MLPVMEGRRQIELCAKELPKELACRNPQAMSLLLMLLLMPVRLLMRLMHC